MLEYVWLAVAAVAAVAEALTTALITLWFVPGALAAFIAALVGAPVAVQLVVFIVVSVVCLVLLRPLAMKHRTLGAAEEPTIVGQVARVVEDIDPLAQTGRIETADHMTWAALSAGGQPIAAGVAVRIVRMESIKAVVEPLV